LRQYQDGNDAALIQESQHFVELRIQALFLGHRLNQAIQAVDYDQFRAR
jgi:hypothetical protein